MSSGYREVQIARTLVGREEGEEARETKIVGLLLYVVHLSHSTAYLILSSVFRFCTLKTRTPPK
jgi:hypothetical protein